MTPLHWKQQAAKYLSANRKDGALTRNKKNISLKRQRVPNEENVADVQALK